ncbi:hypothetical protein [Ktedonospora formicarum]|uniref:Uncharacterized protein n=1 Tax=Ktedonospora formicarum TaxID=2778364 RepID=A0A8J3I309_9CHLR|nr:hypothetical protein [Ktedonospora formicarum]GHO49187.1 hypothetical protein KSX_73500 [Ktedonospora formicarum]
MAVSSQPKQSYQIPTHLKVADTITLEIFGFSLTITMRQGIIVLLGGSLVYSTWNHLFWLDQWAGGGPLLHYILTGMLAFATFIIATFRFRERSLEMWLMLALRYYARSRTFVWHSSTLLTMREEHGMSIPQSLATRPVEQEEEA